MDELFLKYKDVWDAKKWREENKQIVKICVLQIQMKMIRFLRAKRGKKM